MAFGVVNGSPLSVAKSAGRKVAVSGQSIPGFNVEARTPAPYSPVSK
jgi:hypothetical protein